MKSIIRNLAIVVVCIFAALCASGQTVNPATDIRWPSCSPGQAYAPNGNACFTPGGVVVPLVLTTPDPTSTALILKGSSVPVTPTLVQTASGSNNTVNITFSSAVTAGNNILVVTYTNQFTSSACTITDSLSNTYTLLQTNSSSSFESMFVYVAYNSPAGSDTITSNCGGVAGANIAMEYSGLATASIVDVATNTAGSISTPFTVGPVTTNQADLVLSVLGIHGGGTTTATTPSGYTLVNSIAGAGSAWLWVASVNEPTTGTYSASWANNGPTVGASNIQGIQIALKAGSGTVQQSADLMQLKTATNTLLGGITAQGQVYTALIYSAAGTPLPACNSSTPVGTYYVSDATSPTYMGAYTSGGTIRTAVICSYNGTTYSWLTH